MIACPLGRASNTRYLAPISRHCLGRARRMCLLSGRSEVRRTRCLATDRRRITTLGRALITLRGGRRPRKGTTAAVSRQATS